jgi:hypothetical protein
LLIKKIPRVLDISRADLTETLARWPAVNEIQASISEFFSAWDTGKTINEKALNVPLE